MASALDLEERDRRAAEYAAASANIDRILAAQQARDTVASGARLPTAEVPAPPPAASVVADPVDPGRSALGIVPTAPVKPAPFIVPASRPATAGETIVDPTSGARPATGGETLQVSPAPGPGSVTFDPMKGIVPTKPAAPDTAPAAEAPVVAEAPVPPAGAPAPPSALTPGGVLSPTPKPEKLPPEPAPERPKGARGAPKFATERRDEDFPDATEKAVIDPRYLVDLQKSNPALHDGIVAAATAAGIGSWEYANLIYAASKGDSNFRQMGTGKQERVGLAGLTPEDIARYKQIYPDMFREGQDGSDPATNLMLGAKKYREVRDHYGANTPSAIAAYYLGTGRVNQLATLTPEEQRKHIPEETYTQIRETIGGPNAPPKGAAPTLQLTPEGTATAQGAAQAATQAARQGNTQIFTSYMADNLPRGMTPTDGWRHVEGLMVGAMIAKGDFEGAQRAREMVFQMSHVGTVQPLMRALQLMGPDGKGDLQGAARQLAQAYFNSPDGGSGKVYVTNQGLMGQRFNEATGQAVGGMFRITPELVQGMINKTQSPQDFLKTMRESQKLHADIEKGHAENKYKDAQTRKTEAEIEDMPDKAERERERLRLEDLRLLYGTYPRESGRPPVDRTPTESAALEKEMRSFFPGEKDVETGNFKPPPPGQAMQEDLWKDMKWNNRRMAGGKARDVAVDLQTNRGKGAYEILPPTNPSENPFYAVVPKGRKDVPVGFLAPHVVRQYFGQPQQPAASPPQVGATSQPPAF